MSVCSPLFIVTNATVWQLNYFNPPFIKKFRHLLYDLNYSG
jgi:hypothetical protein